MVHPTLKHKYLLCGKRVVMYQLPAVDAQDTAAPAKAFVATAIVYFHDAQLSEGRCAHYTRLNCDIKRNFFERIFRSTRSELGTGEDLIDRLKFCMSSRLKNHVG